MINKPIRNVPHHQVMDFLLCGWQIAIPAMFYHRDLYACHVVWMCHCPPREPRRVN